MPAWLANKPGGEYGCGLMSEDKDNPSERFRAVALVVSGPSGAGKSTVCGQLLTAIPEMHFSVSCTTRAPRNGETDGVQYYFLSRTEFERRIAADAFLEHADVHGNYYGTLRSEVEPFLECGQDVLLDIDVQGAAQLRQRAGNSLTGQSAVYVFIEPPSLAELERRLRGRGTDCEEVIQRRLLNARREMAVSGDYDHIVVNDEVPLAVGRLEAILDAARRGLRAPRGAVRDKKRGTP